MIITNATIKEIPRLLGMSTDARVPPPKLPSENHVAIGKKDGTPSGENEPGKSDTEKAVQFRGGPAGTSVLLQLVQGEESLLKSQEVDSEKPAPEEEVDREGLAELANDLTTQLSGNLRIKFLTDENTGKDYFQLIDKETGEVIRQYPPDEMLRMAEKFQDVSSLIFSSQA